MRTRRQRRRRRRAEPRIVCPTVFMGRIPPPRFWIAEDWVPYGVVTGLYGDGGVGKSLIAQQLQTGTALGSTWLGLPVERIGSLGVYCEDDENELWRRQCGINASYGVDHDALGLKHWMPRLGENNILMAFARNGVGELTTFHRHVIEAALDLEARLVIIDTAADTFGGNENDRDQVRQFVQRALGQIALKIRGAVVCCAHPSRAGLTSGSGDSGSTGWNNAFRSRQYLFEPDAEPDEPPDPNARILERKKANYAAREDRLRLRWHNGVIIPDQANEPGMTSMGKVDARAVFLDLVREMDGQNRPVSSSSQSPELRAARVRKAAERTTLRLSKGRLPKGNERAVQGREDQERPLRQKRRRAVQDRRLRSRRGMIADAGKPKPKAEKHLAQINQDGYLHFLRNDCGGSLQPPQKCATTAHLSPRERRKCGG